MQLLERHYPYLRLMYDTMETAPVNLYMSAPNEAAKQFTLTSEPYKLLLSYFPARQSLLPKQYFDIHYLPSPIYHMVDSDAAFRNKYYDLAMKTMPAPGCGILLLPNGGQYVYMYLNDEDSLRLKQVKGRYLATALFLQESFLGFEEAEFTKGMVRNKLGVVNGTGHYTSVMNPGDYLSFMMVFLGYKHARGPFKNTVASNAPCTIYKVE